jgi:hypothetical protein
VQRSRGAEEQRSRGAEEQRSRGAEEQRSRGAEEQRSREAEVGSPKPEHAGRTSGPLRWDPYKDRYSDVQIQTEHGPTHRFLT